MTYYQKRVEINKKMQYVKNCDYWIDEHLEKQNDASLKEALKASDAAIQHYIEIKKILNVASVAVAKVLPEDCQSKHDNFCAMSRNTCKLCEDL